MQQHLDIDKKKQLDIMQILDCVTMLIQRMLGRIDLRLQLQVRRCCSSEKTEICRLDYVNTAMVNPLKNSNRSSRPTSKSASFPACIRIQYTVAYIVG